MPFFSYKVLFLLFEVLSVRDLQYVSKKLGGVKRVGLVDQGVQIRA